MTTGIVQSSATGTSTDDYVVIGLASCFIKHEGKLQPVQVIEPIPSAALEAILKGIPTSYELAVATTLGAVWQDDTPQRPTGFPDTAQFCDDFKERLLATARSYRSRPTATAHIELGRQASGFNFSTDRKRTLNSERLVSTEDNVKQHAYTHQVL